MIPVDRGPAVTAPSLLRADSRPLLYAVAAIVAAGLEEWIETTAMGWAGDLVYVDMRRTDYGVNACWLHAAEVRRREP